MFNNYPFWSQEFARKYLSRTINTFLLHGNVHDLVLLREEDTIEFHRLKSFLSDEFF